METMNVERAGLAFGFTGALLYVGCALLMMMAGSAGTVKLFNSLLHGLDVSGIARMEVPLGESLLGLVGTFLMGWLTGACIALIYNMGTTKAGGTA
ncbi:MAG: hypothetical protein H6591_02655 [Flavobacteriales bacterium]|nr:hypothetical protein [Flavobacteriales bacterium]